MSVGFHRVRDVRPCRAWHRGRRSLFRSNVCEPRCRPWCCGPCCFWERDAQWRYCALGRRLRTFVPRWRRRRAWPYHSKPAVRPRVHWQRGRWGDSPRGRRGLDDLPRDHWRRDDSPRVRWPKGDLPKGRSCLSGWGMNRSCLSDLLRSRSFRNDWPSRHYCATHSSPRKTWLPAQATIWRARLNLWPRRLPESLRRRIKQESIVLD